MRECVSPLGRVEVERVLVAERRPLPARADLLSRTMAVEVLSMLSHPPQQGRAARPYGDQALRRSWYLFLLSYPWHLLGGGIAYGITWLAGGDFGAGEDVPSLVYPALYVWMMAPLVAAIVVGVLGWVRGHRAAAIVPTLASAAMIGIITVLGYDEFFG